MSESERRGSGCVTFAFVVFALGMVIGYRLLTASPNTDSSDVPTCESRVIKAGQSLGSALVVVDVYNGGEKEGLASKVSTALQKRGFLQGSIANSPSDLKPAAVTILTTNQNDPRVQLVAQQFKDVDYALPDFATSSAVTVLVGDGFDGLNDGAPTSVKTTSDVSLCF